MGYSLENRDEEKACHSENQNQYRKAVVMFGEYISNACIAFIQGFDRPS